MRLGPLIAVGRTAEVFAWDEGSVVKLIRPGFPPDLADIEADILGQVRAAGVPCPEAKGVVDLQGRRGIILERFDGPSMMDRRCPRR